MSEIFTYCNACNRVVTKKKKFSWPIFLAWTVLLLGIGAFVYIIWYIIKPRDVCPICGGHDFKLVKKVKTPAKTDSESTTTSTEQKLLQLTALKDKGLISEEEFSSKRGEILRSLV